jgi:CDP-diacylglycerol--glycerol-3-phosphate 3-phosphatidyltransferase
MTPTDSRVTTPAPPARRFWNVPNSLTVARLVLSIAIFGLIGSGLYAWALGIFIIAAITDALDGYFARLLGQDTPLGRQLDPLIDKVIVSGCYIYLVTIPDTGIYPWMVTVIVVRELLIQGLRSLLEGKGQAFGAKMAGKLKTLVQCLSIVAILIVLSLGSDAPPVLSIVRDMLTYGAVGLTLYSGLSYAVVALPSLRGEL